MYAKVLISYSHLLLAKLKARSGVNLIELLQVYFTSIAIALKLRKMVSHENYPCKSFISSSVEIFIWTAELNT